MTRPDTRPNRSQAARADGIESIRMSSPVETVQRVAVLDPIGNVGGGSRFAGSLLPALARSRPGLHLAFFGRESSMQRDGLDARLPMAGVQTRALEWVTEPWQDRPRKTRWRYNLRRAVGRGPRDTAVFARRRLKKELEAIGREYDVVYFPWPYRIPIPDLACPMICTIHDLNFKYFFGSPVFSPALARNLDNELESWVSAATVVTSSDFMKGEIARFFPGSPATNVIRLAPFASEVAGGNPVIPGLPEGAPYILCANNVMVHKNIGAVIAALVILREAHRDLRLVIVGAGTEQATGLATPIGTIRSEGDGEVIGLGYISNETIDRLIAGAVAVVNASLYEGGNGSGLDAWRLGTPVAMSDIAPFREHLDALGVEAALFDPRSPADIAAKVSDIIDRRAWWTASTERSSAAIRSQTWDGVAAAYLQVFDAALAAARD
jgi:glycosyltransferase involved in cell wall biosynthesis